MTSLPPVFESRGALPPMPPSHRDLINSTRPNTGIVNKLKFSCYFKGVHTIWDFGGELKVIYHTLKMSVGECKTYVETIVNQGSKGIRQLTISFTFPMMINKINLSVDYN